MLAALGAIGAAGCAHMHRTPRQRRVLIGSDLHADLTDTSRKELTAFASDVRESVRPDIAFLVGDLVHRGRDDEFAWFIGMTRSMGCPVRCSLGNHEYDGGPEEAAHERIRRHLGLSDLYYTVTLGNTVFVVLADESNVKVNGYGGYMSPEQLAWFERTVAASSDKNVIVLSHQEVAETGMPNCADRNYVMNPADEVERILGSYDIDLWFCGHFHHGGNHAALHEAGMFAERHGTHFCQVASVSERYGTGFCQSRAFKLIEGQNFVTVRSRDHLGRSFDPRLDTHLPLRHGVRL